MKRNLLIFPFLFLLPSISLWARGGQDIEDFTAEDLTGYSWSEITERADGQTVYFYMWGGSDAINTYVNRYIGGRLRQEYNVTLKVVPVNDASVYINKVLGEQQAGKDSGGAVDLVWINGENFRTMKENGLLFGPYSYKLPNTQYINRTDPSIVNDFGYPVEGYESPYGSAQMVMVFDQARMESPPETIEELLVWIKYHPGRFTYPAPPDFTGSVFIRHFFYYAAGGHEWLLGPFNEELYNKIAPEFWTLLNELEPYLWRGGETYPESHTRLQELFANGEVDFDMSYNPAEAANLVAQGRYPETTRTFVFQSGTIANTHFVAIPYNASAKAGALVTANLLLDPEAQYEKSRSDVWGDLTVLNVGALPPEWRERFNSLERPPSVLSPEELSAAKLPELQADWLRRIEEDWHREVLLK